MKEIYDCHKDFLVFQKKFNLLQNEPLTETDTRSKIIKGIASALNFNKLQKYTSNVHQIQETAQNSLTSQAI